MATSSHKLEWCISQPGKDQNWWVKEISDPIHWDVDALGIIDPRQMGYILELCEALRDYGFDPDILDQAFFAFAIQSEKDGKIRLVRTPESILEDDSTLFALPDIMDEEKGPYADFLDAITRARVRMLNDLIEFDQKLTVDELEEVIRERQNQDFIEGKSIHFFDEIISILEYSPDGFELEEDDERPKSDDVEIEDIPEFDENEKIEEDETMKWEDEDEDDEEEEYDENERPDDFDEKI